MHVLEAAQERLDRNPDAMRTRREVVILAGANEIARQRRLIQ